MGRSVGSRLQRWWPVPAVLLGSLVVQKLLFESRYDVSGHAGEHLTSATAVFPAFASWRSCCTSHRRHVANRLVLATCASWLACTVLVLVGNVRVVEPWSERARPTRRRRSWSQVLRSTRRTISPTWPRGLQSSRRSCSPRPCGGAGTSVVAWLRVPCAQPDRPAVDRAGSRRDRRRPLRAVSRSTAARELERGRSGPRCATGVRLGLRETPLR